ncbi:MAG: Gfo/Idh/MocA family oxidoreductase [Pseudomonadota bacterium]
MAQTKLKTAFVGCGGIARAHWHGVRYVADRIEVTAVVESHEERLQEFAERTGAQPFNSLETALAEGDFDAVDIMLPHNLHETAAAAAFDADKHVLLEKPMAHDLASCERIIARANQSDKIFMIAEQAQYWTDIIKVRELIDAGAIGRVLNARACFYDPTVVPEPDQPVPWRYELAKAGGGISIDGGAHWIRPLRIMLGEIDEVIAVMGQHIPRMEGESWSQALFRFESGATAIFDALTKPSPMAPTEMFRITGTEGFISEMFKNPQTGFERK